MNEKYEEKGLRFLLTYGCSKKCPFCYQLKRTDDRRVLPMDKFKDAILRATLSGNFDYITLFGGEVMEIPDFVQYVKTARAMFPGRINMTTNGDAKLEAYQEVVDAGVNHINFSVNTTLNLTYGLKILQLKNCTKRLNIFLPAEYDERRTVDVIIPWLEKARTMYRCQLSLMYDYREGVDDYEAVCAKIDGIVAYFGDVPPKRKFTGPNYLVYQYDQYFEFWVDVNYRKNQEVIIDPQGNHTRGFDYMVEDTP